MSSIHRSPMGIVFAAGVVACSGGSQSTSIPWIPVTPARGASALCNDQCKADPSVASEVYCGTDQRTYAGCQWACGETPAGISVYPGACQSNGKPSADAPPFPADGVDVCDWLKVGSEWEAVECATDFGGMQTLGSPVSPTLNVGGGPPPNIPTSIDHRPRFSTAKDQSQTMMCTAFSNIAAMEGALAAQGVQLTLSEMHLWSRYHKPAPADAIGAAQGGGIATADAAADAGWTFNADLANSWEKNVAQPDSTTQTGLDALGQFEAAAIDVIQGSDAGQPQPPTVAQLKNAIAEGKDVVAGFFTGPEWAQAKSDGVIPEYALTGTGGHAVLLVGTASINGTNYLLLRNSWGSNWANQGYGLISETSAQANLMVAWTVSVRAKTPAPPVCPTGRSAAVDGTCRMTCADGSVANPQGQCAQSTTTCASGLVPDATGTCVSACSAGSYQDNGVTAQCGPSGCAWTLPAGTAGCVGGPCTVTCPAPSCTLASVTDASGSSAWTCVGVKG